MGHEGGIDQHTHRRSGAADGGRRAHDRRGGQGRPRAVDGTRSGWARPEGRVPALGQTGEHDDRSAFGLHLGSDARGARSRHGRKARRTGAGEGRLGRLEGTDGIGQPDGRQPDRAGPKHRGRDHRRRQWRPFQEDHGRRARRDFAAQGSDQYDGGSASLVCFGSDARGARGRHGGAARRAGGGARRGGHMEGFDGLRERDGLESHRAGAQYRGRDHGGGARAIFRARSRWM